MPCVVPTCGTSEGSFTLFPRHESLSDRWLKAMQVGCGILVELTDDRDLSQTEICMWHFGLDGKLGDEDENRYQEPRMFINGNGDQVEIDSCRLCLQFYPSYCMVSTNGNLGRNDIKSNIYEALRLGSMENDFLNLVCIECLARLELLNSIQKDFAQAEVEFQELLKIAQTGTNDIQSTIKLEHPSVDFVKEEHAESSPDPDYDVEGVISDESTTPGTPVFKKSKTKVKRVTKRISRMSDSDSDSAMDVEAAAEAALAGLLPKKSKALYESAYKKFDEWCMRNKVRAVDEKCLLAYFSQEMANQKPSTKWTHFSMLKATININLRINIGGFVNLISFLKRKSDGYRPKKSKTFNKEQIFKFLKDANDEIFLAIKVVLIVGVYGACRREEILKITLSDIEDLKDSVKITIPNSKTKILRQFVITKGNVPDVDMLNLFRTYAQKRPAGINHMRFFIGYRLGKCVKQAIGINTIGQMPKKIAEFLKLPGPEEYTGHCFRRSSAFLKADSGVDISVLKRHGGWKTSAVENSLQQIKMTAGKMLAASAETSNSEEAENMPPGNITTDLCHQGNMGSVLSSTSDVPCPQEYYFPVAPSTSSVPSISSTPNPVQINNVIL